jgi:hypothetical protein
LQPLAGSWAHKPAHSLEDNAMKLMCKTVMLGLAVTAASAMGCSSGPSTGGSTGSKGGEHAGEIGLNLTLAGGEVINSLAYTLSNGTAADTLTGTIPLPAVDAGAGPFAVPTFEILPVQSGTGYTISLTGTSTDGLVTCSGTSAPPFSVTAGAETAVNVLVTCTKANTAGSVEVNSTLQNCPTVGNLTAILATASTTAPGNTSTIFGSAVGPNSAALTYAFSVTSGTGTLSGQTVATGNVSSSVVFTCPGTAETDTITLVAGDQLGAVCPASLTTLTTKVTCGTSAADAGAPDATAEAGPEAGPEAAADAPADVAPDVAVPPPVACTTAGQTGCVRCEGNTSGLCTPTEADFVNYDIANKLITAAPGTVVADPANGCYSCLFNNGCIDDNLFNDVGNECEDAPLAGGTTAAECESIISCILGSGVGTTQCASVAVSACYCGTAPVSGTCQGNPAVGPINGACSAQISTGLAFPLTDGTDVTKNFNDTTKAGGRADQIFQCAQSNACSACL